MNERSKTTQTEDFEKAMTELEEIVRALDRPETDLDEALALFEQGVDRLRAATTLLDDAEARVEELIEDASGELSAVEFEIESEDDGE